MKEILERLMTRGELDAQTMRQVFGALMEQRLEPPVAAAFLVALRMKGETGAELAAAAQVMRDKAVAVRIQELDRAVDTCGTGGDRSGTVNISTAAAFVAAAGGVPIAKHGNRSVSSRCGSADVLEAAGVQLDLEADALGRLCDEIGIAFLFAPRLHPAMKAVMPVRRFLGVRTTFNMLGPLTNPAKVTRQVLGIWDADLMPLMAEALAGLGSKHALVVHSRDGLDELSASAPTDVIEVRDGHVLERRTIEPEDVGVETGPFDDLLGGDVDENARRLEAMLAGREHSAASDALAMNAGAALWVGDRAEGLRDGVALAKRIIAEGGALELLHTMARRSQERHAGG